MKKRTVRTTLTLPSELLEDTDRAVSQGKAKSRNEFVAQAGRATTAMPYAPKLLKGKGRSQRTDQGIVVIIILTGT
ncbi:MAG: ribbon-helix-helix domain-containing protein [Cyanosarcina radialis HA8281-LM2]|nr:ribbon-helix-helix domain-containing protein [Cyanosarcina radialis HA8281-LM2]